MNDEKQSKKPWFGPKRISYGISPQTSQRWLIVAIVTVIIIVVVRLAATDARVLTDTLR
jgi:hypothetical protein